MTKQQIEQPEIAAPNLMTGVNCETTWGAYIAMNRTCKLVEEWSTKYDGKIEVFSYQGVERRYRVVKHSKQAHDEAQIIFRIFTRTPESVEKFGYANSLKELGYSEAAISEALKNNNYAFLQS